MVDISIIIPVFKVESYIVRCLQSILEQNDCDLSIECILVDDCSPDNSIKKSQSFLKNYKGDIDFIFLAHKKNRGLSAARNTGIDCARGKYILFVDSDDHLLPGSLRKLYEGFVICPNADFVKGNYYSVKSKSPYPVLSQKTVVVNRDTLCYALLNYQINCTAWNMLIKSDFLKCNRLFFKEGLLFEDTDWSYRTYRHVQHAVLLPDVTYIYEDDNPSSIMNTTIEKADASVRSIIEICNSILDSPYPRLIIDTFLYVYTFVNKALRIKQKSMISKKQSSQLRRLRNRLMLKCLQRGNFVLMIYFTMMYPPLYRLYDFGWVRRHNDFFDYKVRIMGRYVENLGQKLFLKS